MMMSSYVDGAAIGVMSGIPGLLPDQLFVIYQDPEHLQDGDGRVKLIEHNLVLLVEFVHLVHDVFLKSSHKIL